jgi:hypothetical protein
MTAMETPPTLRNWRLITNRVLLGQVSARPEFDEGVWILTSALVRPPDLSTMTAWTESRLYLLRDPWPDDRPLPVAAQEPLILRILHKQVFGSMEQVAAAMAAAERIAQRLTSTRERDRDDDN